MKYLFRVWMFAVLTLNAQASLITINYVEGERDKALQASNIFEETYNLPRGLISMKKIVECFMPNKKVIGIDLCIDKNGELLYTGAKNLELTKKSILSFTENSGENYGN